MPNFEERRRRQKKRAAKRAWEHAPRNDRWREAHMIPADAGPALLNHRREQVARFRDAKKPNPPRWLQRQRRLEAIAKRRESQEKHDARIGEALNPKPLLVPAA
jgi:hypothetical protein